MDKPDGDASPILTTAGLLAVILGAAVFTTVADPKFASMLRSRFALPLPSPSPTSGLASATPVISASPAPQAPAQPSPSSATQPAPSPAQPSPASALEPVQNPLLRCYSSVDCYAARGYCMSRLVPEAETFAVPNCGDCICICIDQYCQSYRYIPNPTVFTPIPTPVPAPNSTPVAVTPIVPTPYVPPVSTPYTPPTPYNGKGAVAVKVTSPSDVYVDNALKAHITQLREYYTIFGIEPGTRTVAISNPDCYSSRSVSISVNQTFFIAAC